MLKERQQIRERPILTTERGSSLQSEIHRRASKCLKGSDGLVQTVWNVCLDKIVEFVVSSAILKERNEKGTTLMNMFPNYGAEVLNDVAKIKLMMPRCAQSLRTVHLSVPGTTLVASR